MNAPADRISGRKIRRNRVLQLLLFILFIAGIRAWQQRDMVSGMAPPLAGVKLEEILGSRWNESAALADAERDIIMRAAVAYSLGGEEPALDKLREHYAAKMDESADAKAFAVVTERIENQGVAFRDLAKRIASVDSLQAMMDEFKKSGTALASAAAGN